VTVRLYEPGFAQARSLIVEGKVVYDERDDWSEHQPSTEKENRFIAEHGLAAYAKWHLGTDDEVDPESKRHYKFPYGDFAKVHRCALLTAESRAGQYKHFDIELAVAHLHGMIEMRAALKARAS
jgi:hypothetical protein